MKKEKFEVKVNEIKSIIFDFCKKLSLEIKYEKLNYSLYIKSNKEKSFEDIKNQLKEYLINLLKISKKQIKKIITVLEEKDRIYILFKNKVIID